MADDLTKHLKSYTKDQLIARYNMKETYTNSQLKKIPKIELMEEIYGGGLKDGDAFRKGGFVKRPSKKKGVARGCGKVMENRRKVTKYI